MSTTESHGWLSELWLPLSPRGGLAALLAFALLQVLAFRAGLLGLFLAWVLLFAFARHLVDVLLARAHARPWPAVTSESFNPFTESFRLGIAALFFISAVVGLALLGSAWWLALFGAAILALLPATLALSAVDGNVGRWLDVSAALRLASRLGRDYVILLALWAVAPFAAMFTGGSVGSDILALFCVNYFTVVVFSATGWLIYRHREALDFDVYNAPEARNARAEAPEVRRRQQSLSLAYNYFSRGNEPGGRTVLKNILEAEHYSVTVCDWLFAELDAWELDRPLLLVAPLVIDAALARDDVAGALDVAERCLDRDPAATRALRNVSALRAAAGAVGRDDLVRRLDG